jgi:carbonic anhydrase
MRKKTALALLASVLAVAAYAAEPPAWNHDPNSDTGLFRWGSAAPVFATCGTTMNEVFVPVGLKQSPIDIHSEATKRVRLPRLNLGYGKTPLEVENTGHVIEAPYERGSLRISDTDPADAYESLQFHFHTPSEHAINGKLADMELHIVHRNVLGDLAVIGVLMNVGSHPNELVDEIISEAPITAGTSKGHREIDVQEMLPESRQYYTYSGSLTTPPCSEGVRWIVMKEPVNVSSFAVERLHLLVSSFPNYGGFGDNNRPTTELNGRVVLEGISARRSRTTTMIGPGPEPSSR